MCTLTLLLHKKSNLKLCNQGKCRAGNRSLLLHLLYKCRLIRFFIAMGIHTWCTRIYNHGCLLLLLESYKWVYKMHMDIQPWLPFALTQVSLEPFYNLKTLGVFNVFTNITIFYPHFLCIQINSYQFIFIGLYTLLNLLKSIQRAPAGQLVLVLYCKSLRF